MPHHITHGDAIEVAFEKTHERLLRRDRWVRSLTAVAQQQPKMTAGQRRNHQEMIGADTVVKVVCPIGKAVQMNIEILKEAAGVVLTLDGHSEAAAYTGIDAVSGDEVAAADKLFLVAAIGMSEPRRNAVRLQRQVLKCRVVFDGLAKSGARVIAHERFGLALVVRQNAVVSRIDRGVIETRTDFRSLAVTEEVHHVSFAPKIAFEGPLAQLLVHEIEQLDRACMHRDGPRLTTRARHAFDTSILDAAERQLHRQHAPGCASTDGQYGYFNDVRHPSSPGHQKGIATKRHKIHKMFPISLDLLCFL